MKDLDFDELDRAVNSLVGGPPAVDVAALPAQVPLVTDSTPVSVSSSPVLAAQPLAARRSSGRFMDVVHPSSDMRSSTPVAAVIPVSRIGAMVAPRIPSATPEPVTPVAVATVATESATGTTKWPDPLDFHLTTTEQASSGAPSSPPPPLLTDEDDSDIAKIADDINASLSKDTTTPLDSPFLSDAKVEKRPLGAFSTDASTATTVPAAVTPVPVVSDPDITAAEAPKTEVSDDHPIGTDTPLPAELQSDLLSIESVESAPSSTPESHFIPPAVSTDVPSGPTSIVQQYSETPSTGDQPVAALFDTAAYKKPTSKQKKKSGWFVMLWIFLLLVVGGGIGAAVYFFVLPML
jgi:hypothetical protein